MDAADVLISKGKIAKRFGVTPRSIDRWGHHPDLNFPKPCFINGRQYFSQFETDMWRDRRFGVSPDGGPRLSQRGEPRDPA